MTTEYLRYVPHRDMIVHLCLGWRISDELHFTTHGQYCVLMVRDDDPAVIGSSGEESSEQ